MTPNNEIQDRVDFGVLYSSGGRKSAHPKQKTEIWKKSHSVGTEIWLVTFENIYNCDHE